MFKLKLYCCFVDKQSDKSATQHRESYVEMNINANDDTNATIGIDDANHVDGVDEYHQLRRTVVLSLIHRSINKDNLIIKYWKLFKLELYCCFVDKESHKSAMQHRE